MPTSRVRESLDSTAMVLGLVQKAMRFQGRSLEEGTKDQREQKGQMDAGWPYS